MYVFLRFCLSARLSVLYVILLHELAVVRRMLDYTQEPGDAMCLNLVVETWCISGNMRQANKALARMRQDFGCEPDEQVW